MSTEKSNGLLDGISHGATHRHAADMCQQSRVRFQGRPVREPVNPSPEHFSVLSLSITGPLCHCVLLIAPAV